MNSISYGPALAIKISVVVAVAVTSLYLAGCQEHRYLARRDGVTMGVGDANATNKATHTINPWPRYAKDTKIKSDGKRVLVGVKRYQENNSIEPQGLPNDTTVSVEEAPNGQASPGTKRY